MAIRTLAGSNDQHKAGVAARNRVHDDVPKQGRERRLSGGQLSAPVSAFFRHAAAGIAGSWLAGPRLCAGRNARTGGQRVCILVSLSRQTKKRAANQREV